MFQYGIPCKINNLKYFLLINTQRITLSPEKLESKENQYEEIKIIESEKQNKEIINIEIEAIKSIRVKSLETEFLLKISASIEYIIFFNTHLDRDIVKSLIIYIQQEIKEKNLMDIGNEELKNELKSYEINMEVQDVKVNENKEIKLVDLSTKNDLFLLLLELPILLTIYSLLQSSPKQFFNLLKLSYFYDISNEKNVIDRRVQELCGNDLEFSNRINYQMTSTSEVELPEKIFTEKEIQFEPVYPYEQKIEENEKEFIEPILTELTVDIGEPSEEIEEINEFFMGNLVKISSFVWENRNNEEKKEELKRLAERIEEKIPNKTLFKRVLPSFFLKKE